MPISQFNAPNVAYQRSNRFAINNLQKPEPIQKNGKTKTPRAKGVFYTDDDGKRQKHKIEKTYIKNVEGRATTAADRATTCTPSIEVKKGFTLNTGRYSYDPTTDGSVTEEVSNYVRHLSTRIGVFEKQS